MEQEKETFKAFIQSCLDFVVNNKKEKVENEDVDKRKLIDEVAGIMKSAGCDDEAIRTAIGKMEKIGYDKSEAKTADNEDDKAEEKDEKADDEEKAENKCKNEADEEAEDKQCDNSKEVDYMAEVAKVSTEVKNEAEAPVEYVSRADKLQAAIDYFKVN